MRLDVLTMILVVDDFLVLARPYQFKDLLLPM